MEKRFWMPPCTEVERFVPNQYVAACVNYSAVLECTYGKNKQNYHGEPCSETTLTSYRENKDGSISYAGHEKATTDNPNKGSIVVEGLKVTSQQPMQLGSSVTWTTYDGGTYTHTGTVIKFEQMSGTNNFS